MCKTCVVSKCQKSQALSNEKIRPRGFISICVLFIHPNAADGHWQTLKFDKPIQKVIRHPLKDKETTWCCTCPFFTGDILQIGPSKFHKVLLLSVSISKSHQLHWSNFEDSQDVPTLEYLFSHGCVIEFFQLDEILHNLVMIFIALQGGTIVKFQFRLA